MTGFELAPTAKCYRHFVATAGLVYKQQALKGTRSLRKVTRLPHKFADSLRSLGLLFPGRQSLPNRGFRFRRILCCCFQSSFALENRKKIFGAFPGFLATSSDFGVANYEGLKQRWGIAVGIRWPERRQLGHGDLRHRDRRPGDAWPSRLFDASRELGVVEVSGCLSDGVAARGVRGVDNLSESSRRRNRSNNPSESKC